MLARLLILFLGICTHAYAEQAKPYRCEDIAEHRQFDFWLGNWEVTDKAGEQFYGKNRISKRENGCLLLEEYHTEKGFRGSSMNYYNPADGQWYQHWVDNGTSIIQTVGGIDDGAMRMQGRIHYMQGGRSAGFRGSWTPLEDGRVRQYFEEQDAEGNWQTWFDGYYRRVD